MLTLLLAALAAAGDTTAPAPPKPALVLSLVVDQLRPDYLDRWRPQFTGGFKQLLDGGVYYRNGMQDHAVTETAPGHASVLSGRFPRNTGIRSNNRGVPDPAHPLVGAAGPGASPARFVGTTLYDWMVLADSTSRVVSVSRKDRGAILPVGRAGKDVYWFQRGTAVTSRWYADSLPAWVQGWNARKPLEKLAGTTWNLLLPESEYPESDAFDFEDEGREPRFPHPLPATAQALAARVADFPWTDSLTFDLALAGMQQAALGRRGATDLLSVSLSTLDAIGHSYGPDSREVHDHMLRLDRWMGVFLDSVRTLAGGPVLITLTSDHGVQTMPDYAALSHKESGYTRIDSVLVRLRKALRQRYNADFDLGFDSGIIFADTDALRARGVNLARFSDQLATEIARIEGMARVFTPATLARASSSDVTARRWRHLAGPEGWLVAATLREGWIWSSRGGYATHGSVWAADANVPIIMTLPGGKGITSDRAARTVDIAPTLARYLGLTPSEKVDGVVLPEVLK